MHHTTSDPEFVRPTEPEPLPATLPPLHPKAAPPYPPFLKPPQQAGLDSTTTQAVLDVNEQSRVDGLRAALALLVLIAVIRLFFTRSIPQQQPGAQPELDPTIGDEPVIVASPG